VLNIDYRNRRLCKLEHMPQSRCKILVVLPLLLIAGCDTSRIDKLEKENHEILSRLQRQETVQDFDLRAKCAVAAKAYFLDTKEDYRRPPSHGLPVAQILEEIGYSDHYNKSLNKCLVRIQFYVLINGAVTNSVNVDDVHDRVNFASFYAQNAPPTVCNVQEVNCTSLAEFENMLKPFMAD